MICIHKRTNAGIDVKLFLAKPVTDIIRLFIQRNLLSEMNDMLLIYKSTEGSEAGSTRPLLFWNGMHGCSDKSKENQMFFL
jgi:hypothetical protein